MACISNIGLVTDSASDIPWEYADEHGIKIVPLTISSEDSTFKENREYDFRVHYESYRTKKNFSPKTSQPTPQEFYLAFEELVNEGKKEIIVICISSLLSGTMNSAKVASEQVKNSYKDVTFYLIDSKNASYAEGFLVEEAVDLRKKGLSGKEIATNLRKLVKNIYSFLFIPTLKYLYRGGRVGLTKYLAAKLLRKKVIIRTTENGSLQPVGAINGVKEGLEKISKLVTKNGSRLPRKVAIVYAINHSLRYQALDYIKKNAPKEIEIRVLQTRAAITAHVGPTAVAVIADFGY